MDLFSFSDDKAEITVNANWLQHLQERLLGDDGHPHKVRARRVTAGCTEYLCLSVRPTVYDWFHIDRLRVPYLNATHLTAICFV